MPVASTTDVVGGSRRTVCMLGVMQSRVPWGGSPRQRASSPPRVRKCAPFASGSAAQEGQDSQNPAVVLGARRHAELVEDVRDVLLHSALGDLEPLGDALV